MQLCKLKDAIKGNKVAEVIVSYEGVEYEIQSLSIEPIEGTRSTRLIMHFDLSLIHI